jgi:hypothetical protein
LFLFFGSQPVLSDPAKEKADKFLREELEKNPNALANPRRLADKFMRNILAENPTAFDLQDKKTYGRDSQGDKTSCSVWTMVDLISDKKYPSMECWGPGVRIAIGNRAHREGLTLSVYTGAQRIAYDLGEEVPMVLRFYPGPVIKRQGKAMGGAAEVEDQQFINSILVQLANEGRLVAVVGMKSGIIEDLTGAARAIQDFQQRIAAGPQTLDITPANASE